MFPVVSRSGEGMDETGKLLLSAVFLTESGLLVGQVGCDVLVEELMCNFFLDF